MLIQETQPSLSVMRARRKMAPLWKKGMAELQVERIRRKACIGSECRADIIKSLTWASSIDEGITRGGSNAGRIYAHYNAEFEPYLKRDILDALFDIAQGKNRPIRIWDDGAGHGKFLAYVKKRMADEGMCTETTATTLKLFLELEMQDIDRVYVGPSESFIPEKKQDLIISFMGPVYHLPQSIGKEIILKYAYSLEKGGLLMLTTPSFPFNARNKTEEFEALSASLAKRGFKVIHAGNYTSEIPKYPTIIAGIQPVKFGILKHLKSPESDTVEFGILIIQRIK